MGSDGFTWSGSLDETDIRALYATCQSLRFSGKLELIDGPDKAEVSFVGGEPIEIDGGDTQRIALWSRGRFRAVQSIPNLDGDLTGQRQMEGTLAITKASELWAWISEYRLSCDIDLERPGAKALVSFNNGHAESAQINGQPEMAALAHVSAWADGNFRVRLRPLFVDGGVPQKPIIPESPPPLGRQFDVSRSIPMDLKPRDPPQVPLARFGPPRPAGPPATPPLPPDASAAPPPPSPTSPSGEAATSPSSPPPSPPSLPPPPPPLAMSEEAPPPPVSQPFEPGDRSLAGTAPKATKLPWLLSLGGIALAGGLGSLYTYRLPPFSRPPVVTAPATPHTESAAPATAPRRRTADPASVTEPGSAKPTEAATRAAAKEAPRPHGAEAEAEEAEAPEPDKGERTTSPTEGDEETAKPASPKKPDSKRAHADKPWEKYLARGRSQLIAGHPRGAREWFHRAQRLAPHDATVRLYELQAQGKLGRAEILLEGRGLVEVDGHRFIAPRRLRVMAGPHVVDLGAGEDEITLKRGEKKKIRIRKK